MICSRAPSARGWWRIALLSILAAAAVPLFPGSAGGFGYLTEWGKCPIRPGEQLNPVQSLAVPSDGRAVFVGDETSTGGVTEHLLRLLAFTPSGRLVRIRELLPTSAHDRLAVGIAPPDGVYAARSRSVSFEVEPEIRRFVFDSAGFLTQAAAWGRGEFGSGYYFQTVDAVLGSILTGQSGSLNIAFVLESGGGLFTFRNDGTRLGAPLDSNSSDQPDRGVALTGIPGEGGNVVVAEAGGTVARFKLVPNPGGPWRTTLITRWPVGGVPVGVAYTRGALWVLVDVEDGPNVIRVYTPDGTLIEQHDEREVPGGLAGANAIAADAAGNVYVSELTRIVKLGPEGVLPPTGGGSDSPPAEVCGPEVALSGARTQRVLRQGGVVVYAQPDDQAALVASGSVSVPGAGKLVRFKTARREAGPDVRTKVKLKLSKRGLRAIRRALGQRRRLKTRIQVGATDPARIRSVTKGTVYLKR